MIQTNSEPLRREAVVTARTAADVPARRSPSVAADWRLGFESCETEQVDPVELEVRGEVPRDLTGALYRIGPGRMDVHGDRNRHWFDGDGLVNALCLRDGRVHYRSRFVATPGKADEDAAKKRIYAGFATRAPGGPFARWSMRNRLKNPANTNIVSHGGKLRALCEAGRPFLIDPVTLATIGEDDMGGVLGGRDDYSAHPKLDRATGAMWNFGIEYGAKATIHVYETTKEGVTTRRASVVLPMLAMVHDFALTPTKVVLVIVPIALPTVPVGVITGQRSFGESLRWRPELGAHVALIERATGAITWHRGDAFMMFHTVNAFDDGDDAVVDVCAYDDAAIMQTTVDVMSGTPPTVARPHVDRLRIGPRGLRRETRSALPIEFPRVAGRVLGVEHTRIYGTSWGQGMPLFGEPAAIDLARGTVERAEMGAGEIAGECVPVTKKGGSTESDVWLLTLVLDPRARRTELRVLDGGDLRAPPVARVALPRVVPFGFHGNWVPAPSAAS
jgi:all-trans-8'-apo-beta-carotenal 15,15'-oxygenase